MLQGSRTVADIGCDHGRLCCALLQQKACKRCIAIDVSAFSIEKTRHLAAISGLDEQIDIRLGDGFQPLQAGEADGAALMGMGGTLMARLLEACAVPFCGMERIVFQPMRAAEDIRLWLYECGCQVTDDRIVRDAGRLYQIFSIAVSPESAGQVLPAGWPENFWKLGYTAFERRDPLLRELANAMLLRDEKRLEKLMHPENAAELQHDANCLKSILMQL